MYLFKLFTSHGLIRRTASCHHQASALPLVAMCGCACDPGLIMWPGEDELVVAFEFEFVTVLFAHGFVCSVWWPLWRSGWASINLTSGRSSITGLPKRWSRTIRRSGGPAETGCPAHVTSSGCLEIWPWIGDNSPFLNQLDLQDVFWWAYLKYICFCFPEDSYSINPKVSASEVTK